MDFKELKEVPVVVYGNLEKYNEVLSKGRCRIFYKGANRNGSYITPEFAEKLISTLPYAPVKGIYDDFNEDFTDHGTERTQGRIYGIVPENPNFNWEIHEDEDGVEREYACVDVYLFTGIYKEAEQIIGKAQSMEIYEPSIKGEWMTIEGQRAFVFTDGCFLGLQVLGDEVEPCFEGAAFFSLYKSLNTLIEKLEIYERNLNNPESNEGGQTMFDIFRLSDDAKYAMLMEQLNPNYNEENDWDLDYMVHDVYDDYAVVYACKDKHYERVYYSKDDSAEEITLGEKKRCFIVDVTEEEKSALETIQALNGGSYELIDENFGKVEDFNATIAEKDQEIEDFTATIAEKEQNIEELNASIATLESEKAENNENYAAMTEQVEELKGQVEALEAYKLEVETNEKEAVINKYAARIDEEVLAPYREQLTDYTVTNLEKDLALELVKSTPSIFELEAHEEIIPAETHERKSSVEQILDKYEGR